MDCGNSRFHQRRSTKLMKSALPHSCNKQRQDVHRAGQSVGGKACTTYGRYGWNSWMCNSPAGRSRNSVPLHYHPCAQSGILFDHAQNLFLYVLGPRSSMFLPVRRRLNVPYSLRLQWIDSKISYLNTVIPLFLVGT